MAPIEKENPVMRTASVIARYLAGVTDPTISSITTAIMITTSNSPAQGSVVPNHYAGDLTLAGNITDLPSFATGRKFLT